MSENGITVGVAANGKVKLHVKNGRVAVGIELEPSEAKRVGSTMQSEAHHASSKSY